MTDWESEILRSARTDVEALEAYIAKRVLDDPIVCNVFRLMASESVTKEHGMLILVVELLRAYDHYKAEVMRMAERQVAPPIIIQRSMLPPHLRPSLWRRFKAWLRGSEKGK